MAIEDLYISCVRKRALTPTLNANYEAQTTYSSTNINGYIGKRTETEIVIADQSTVKSKFKFFTDDLSIGYNDYVVYDSKTYRVISQPENPGNFNHHIEVSLELLDNVP